MATVLKMLRKPGEFFPPGYLYTDERNTAGVLLALGIIQSLHFFVRLQDIVEGLYYMDATYGRTRMWEATAEPFLKIVWVYGVLFLPFFLFLGAMMVYHYFYYYRETKSIYLVRRLPEKGFLWKSCVQMPLLGMGAGAAVMAILFLLYYGSYLLLIPAECAPGLW